MRKKALVPGKGQFIAEGLYNFVRNTIARDSIGEEYKKYLPYLVALFFFVLVNNLFGLFFLTLYPTMSGSRSRLPWRWSPGWSSTGSASVARASSATSGT